MKTQLLGKTPEELREIAVSEGLPAFTGKQLARWMYVKKVRSFSEMTDIPQAGRERLGEKYEVGVTPYLTCQISSDGTKKYLFPVSARKKQKGKGHFFTIEGAAFGTPNAARKRIYILLFGL